MTEWSIESEWPRDQYDLCRHYNDVDQFYPDKPSAIPCYLPPPAPYTHAQLCRLQPPSPAHKLLLSPPHEFGPPPIPGDHQECTYLSTGESPRVIRNKAEKLRRDKLSRSISELAALVPPVVAANRKVDKTGVLRLTAHFLRSHQHVFGDSIGKSAQEINGASTHTFLSLLKGFLITTTYKGIIVVVSQNVKNYLGYSELDLLGQKIFNIVHPNDHMLLMEQLMPRSGVLGSNGELRVPDGPDGKKIITEALASEKRKFTIRFKKLSDRSEQAQYVTCVVEGNLRKSDRASRASSIRSSLTVRRARARGTLLSCSGNDVVFIGLVRPVTETFMTESRLEACRLEYRTRHSVDGEIIQVDQRISLVTGYMPHEVSGVNAMNFMHRDDVRWVIGALRDMYDQNSLFGESCYRLITKNGQFIYMRTHGMLDVDEQSRAVRSFVCTNTQVEEEEGKVLITTMKQRLMMMIENDGEIIENQNKPASPVPVEDPKRLEKVILDLVTNLPSPQAIDCRISPERGEPGEQQRPLAIIPPRRDRIVSAIGKIYGVIKIFQKNFSSMEGDQSPEPPLNKSPTVERPPETNDDTLINAREVANTNEDDPMNTSKPSDTDENTLMSAKKRRQAFCLQGFDRLSRPIQQTLIRNLSSDDEDDSSVSLITHGPSSNTLCTANDTYSTELSTANSYTQEFRSPDSTNITDFTLLSPDEEPNDIPQAGTSGLVVGTKRPSILNDKEDEDSLCKKKSNSGGQNQLDSSDFITFSSYEDLTEQPESSGMNIIIPTIKIEEDYDYKHSYCPSDDQEYLLSDVIDISDAADCFIMTDRLEDGGDSRPCSDLQQLLMDYMDGQQDDTKA